MVTCGRGIFVGSDHALALRSDGTLVAWGKNTYGQLNLPTEKVYSDIAAGEDFSIGLTQESAGTGGYIKAAGKNDFNQVTGVPKPQDAYIHVAAGTSTGAALGPHGQIILWGKTLPGIQPSSTETDFTDISLGATWGLAIKEPAKEIHLTGPLSPGQPIPNSDGANLELPLGAIIEHTDNGVTRIFAPNGTLMGWVNDEEAPMIPTPSGKTLPSSHIYDIPSGSFIQTLDAETTHVNLSDERILTDINYQNLENPTFKTDIPYYATEWSGWVEDSNTDKKSELGQFIANWTVPSSPPNSTTKAIVYIFNGIQNAEGSPTSIVQPVLEYNLKSHAWTGAAWYTHGSDIGYRSKPVDISVGNTAKGTLSWNSKKSAWNIIFENTNSGSTSTNFSVDSPEIGKANLNAYCTLEAYNIIDDKDISGKINFKDIRLKTADLVDVTPGWSKYTSTTMGLTNLDVTWTSDEKEVTLQTKNA
jgi:hypothetical protein